MRLSLWRFLGPSSMAKRMPHFRRQDGMSHLARLLGSVCLGCVLYVLLVDRGHFGVTETAVAEVDDKGPVILLWTKIWGRRWKVNMTRCPLRPSCRVTYDRSLVDRASAVLAHVRDLNASDPLPDTLPSGVKVVAFNMEAPPFAGSEVRRMGRAFHWTMTYHGDSDIVYPYGWFEERSNVSEAELRKEEKKLDGLIGNKTKLGVWMVSNCDSHSGREAYFRQLKKQLPELDMLGGCGKRKCEGDREACEERLARTYKFYFAFENSVCDHYVTEKFFRRLSHGLVPVVLSRGTHKGVIPADVPFLAADDFASPRHLAQRLSELDRDDQAYRRLFDWRRKYSVHSMEYRDDIICAVCDKLHKAGRSSVSRLWDWLHRTDFHRWWLGKGHCKKDYGLELSEGLGGQ